MAVPEVNKKLLEQLEDMGFPRGWATRALHYSGNSGIEEAINWFVDHENDSNIDEMPLVAVDIVIDCQPFHITEQMRIKAQELRFSFERIRASKELTEAKQTAKANERERYLVSWKAEKEDEKRARERILKKLEQDKVERRFRVGLPSERPAALKSSPLQGKKLQNSVPVKSVRKAEQLRECLRSLNRNHQDEGTTVGRVLQTLLIYVGNVAKNPDEEKFRKIRLSNPSFQDRVGNLSGGLEFLELCGFEKTTEGEFLYLPRDKVDMKVLNTAGYELTSAMTNPFLGLLSH
ncbi:hypothetical protein FH972_002598 [Carpinus fangiana]|uniref:UBA domain-containing protein n=1 Tax=Carpinus fangiana TaxID=176857 RepID=A0A5N6QH83_9ROSI|nr:hypothetical protein FH972_002598 [Carpinus fangiana]